METKSYKVDFRFDGKPLGKPRMTRRDRWLDPPRPAVERWRIFKEAYHLTARAAGFDPAKHEVTNVVIACYFQVPKSWSKKKKMKMSLLPHQQVPDISNILKACEDALTDRDQSIYAVSATKWWTVGPPYIETGLQVRLID